MKQCCGEGQLRAYLDGELPPVEAEALELHLAKCAKCMAAREELAATASRVSLLLGSMSADIPLAPVAERRPSVPAVWVAVAAMAAAALVATLLPKHAVPPAAQAVVAPLPATPAMVEEPAVALSVPAPPRRIRRAQTPRAHQVATQEYMALDDEPIDTGFVMRMAMPSGVLADVIVDGGGRARAIRPIRANFKENR